jgi:hypothetical protein
VVLKDPGRARPDGPAGGATSWRGRGLPAGVQDHCSTSSTRRFFALPASSWLLATGA